MRTSDDSHLENVGMGSELRLDEERRYVLSA
jgi:hypothetical protein